MRDNELRLQGLLTRHVVAHGDQFFSGVCENEYEMVPLDLREKIHYAQMRTGLPRIQWLPVFKITGEEHREFKLAHDHDRVGRLL